MSLPGSLLSAKPKDKELVPSLTIQNEYISHPQRDVEELSIPRSHTHLGPLGSSDKVLKKYLRPHSPATDLVKDGASGQSRLSGDFLTVPGRLDLPYSPCASDVGSPSEAREKQCFERPPVPAEQNFGKQDCPSILIRDFMVSNRTSGCEMVTQSTATNSSPNESAHANRGNQSLDVQFSSPYRPPSYAQVPRIRTGIPADELTSRESHPNNQASQGSESSAAIFTKPETPIFGRWSDGSGFSFDGMAASAKKRGSINDTGQNPIDYDNISPTSNVPPQSLSASPLQESLSPEGASKSFYLDSETSVANRTIDARSDLYENVLDNSVLVIIPVVSPSLNEGNAGECSSVDPLVSSQSAILRVPREISGELNPPGSHIQLQSNTNWDQRESKRHSIRTFYRQARTVFLRRRVLQLLIGRQLAGPTREGLRAISKGHLVNTANMVASESDNPRPSPC